MTSALFASLCAALTLTADTAALAQTTPKTDAVKVDAQKPAVPNEPTVTTATYGSWVLRCVQVPAQATADGKPARASGQTCEVAQTVQVQGQQQPIAQVALGRLPGEKDLTLTALLPVNISLPGQVRLSGNGKSGTDEKGGLALAWQRCLGGACIASAKPDTATLAVIRASAEGNIRFTDATGNTVAIPLSWAGLDQAITALEKLK
ncbi:invasion associated locus B family protein [Rhizobium oryzicola]|uniref:Invasion associated locus B family protein n=1 Tax=Rhizobium oryzicola TaxID=1232668 RepID=A0ABT8SZP5_9HYPH|nr:invasion associated locus B family protein [Rhizobium oryzicola]MDO1583461.1 invasion associated locus B family protein [Rhizobium oryzicola]